MIRWLTILLLGSLLGAGSAALAIRHEGDFGATRVGPWTTQRDAGGAGRSPYARAAVAVYATLALSRQETLYFRAASDSQGSALLGNCTYTVHGPDLPARWWSMTLYGADHFLLANPQHRYSFASSANGGFSITVGPAPQPGNWLNTTGASGIVLLVRLYQPTARAAADPAAIAMPEINRGTCQ